MITTRVLTTDDLADFRALHRAGLAHDPEAFVQTPIEDAAVPDEPIAEMLARGEGWGAFEGERLVAKMVIDQLPYAALKHTAYIHALCVHPDARGAGVAKALLRTVLDDGVARGITRFLLWVNAENQGARRLYERLGFAEIGRVPGGHHRRRAQNRRRVHVPRPGATRLTREFHRRPRWTGRNGQPS